MDEEKQTHDPEETIPERVRRVAGHSLPAEPRRRWLSLIALSLLGILAMIVGLGIAIGSGAVKVFEHHVEKVKDAAK